jgi:UDP-N-acetylmuramoyl-tripeptide--D-alanyl-D-alanine ligase
VIDLTVAQVAEIVGGELADISAADAARLHITGTVEFDSRAVTPGGLFLALPGARADGHDHAAAAVAAGAVAVLAARPVGVPAIVVRPDAPGDRSASVLEHDRDGSGAAVLAALARLAAAVAARLIEGGLTIVGVTGSSGKTSTKDLLAAVLAPLGDVIAPPGSFNNELGHPWTVLRATAETDYLVLEMSARHPGNIAALAAIAPPQIAVVLNVGTAHLGEFGSRQAIADTKAELPQAVPASGVVVLNVDDSAVAAMADKTAARVVRVSRSSPTAESTMPPRNEGEEERGNPVDVWAENVVLDDLARASFTLRHGDEAVPVHLAVFGDHQVSNALCAAAVALECGATGEQVAAALAAAGPASPSRMDVVTRSDGVTVINDAYNANPDSMRAGLQALAWMARPGSDGADRRRSWAVLGEMAELGDDAISEHDRIGRLVVRLDVSRLVVVGTGRSMSAMHQGAVMEGSWGAEAMRVDDADTALAVLRAELRAGDVVLVKASNSAGLAGLAQALLDEANGAAPR